MTDKYQALQNFWESFDIPAYDENTVPENAQMPYITYEAQTAADTPMPLTASIWSRTRSYWFNDMKEQEIRDYIGDGFRVSDIDGGYLYISKDGFTAQRMTDPNDSMIRRTRLSLNCTFFTAT